MDLTPRRTIALLVITAATMVAQEVLLTRVLSVTTWSSLAYAVLSLAMLGLTAGSLQAARASRAGGPIGPWVAERLLVLSAALLVAVAVTVVVPIVWAPTLTSLASILLVTVANTAPFIAGGAVVARIMSSSTVSLSALYAVDLVAAAAGALAPLGVLGPLSGPSATVALAAVAAVGAWLAAPNSAGRRAIALAGSGIAIILLTEFSPAGLRLYQAKGQPLNSEWTIDTERWSPLSYVTRSTFRSSAYPFWSMSSAYHGTHAIPTADLRIDGDAETFIHAYRDLSDLDFLRYDITSAVHYLRPHGTACILGMGGGRDALSALVFGHAHVLAAEINPVIIGLLHEVDERSPVLRDSRVETVIGDGRSVMASHDVHCSVLQASLVDTWAATSAGAFAHTEATLYTREAWSLFLNRVAPDGVVTFTRWYREGRVGEIARLVALAVGALLDRGIENARDYIAVVTSPDCATVLISPAPFSAADREALRRLETDLHFVVLVSPDVTPADPLLNRLVSARSQGDLRNAGTELGLDTSAPTDDRPFFFQLLAPSAWLHPLNAVQLLLSASGVGGGVIPGNFSAIVGMGLVILAVLLIGGILLAPTLISSVRAQVPPLPGARAYIYFGALGGGFMITELALVQRLHVVLGHPTYALVVVLASLLVATGVGSALSPMVLTSRRTVSYAAVVTALLLAAIPAVVIEPLARATAAHSFVLRALWCGLVSSGIGFLLGMFFPSGLRFVSRDVGAPTALAINGMTSVLGSAAAMIVSVAFGISASFALAGLCYLIAGFAGPDFWRRIDNDTNGTGREREGKDHLSSAGPMPAREV